ncbi:transglutaminase-like domain-containing protein [Myxococcota bacterium]|nr:transglutaminase-like domain-containing protein [Myxococcota bacterium]
MPRRLGRGARGLPGAWPRVAALLAITIAACASAPRGAEPGSGPRLATDDPARGTDDEDVGEVLSSAVRDGAIDGFDLADAALVASGYDRRLALRQARARFETLVAPIVEGLAKVPDPRERARLLLVALHQKGGPLGEYDARATTLAEVLDRRRYNCVSASVVYNLLAERLTLPVAAELLPTHARTVLALDPKRPVIIETTSPDGFAPDPRLAASILAQVGGQLAEDGRHLVPDQGSIVTTLVLIGTIYVNRASIVQEAGDLKAAEHLFGRGEVFAGSAEMRRVLRDQRAALLSQLGADDVLSEDPARLPRAYRTLRAAAALDPSDAQTRAAVLQNLRAAAERLIHALAEKKDEGPLVELAREAAASGLDADDRAGLRAFALSEVARLRMDRNDFDGAVEAIELAMKEKLGADDAKLAKVLAQNRVSALRVAALTAAKQGNYPRGVELLERAQRLPGLTSAQETEIRDDLLRVVHLAGNQRIDASDFPGAATIYRDGVRRFPKDETARHNLVAVLERLALPIVSKLECQAAEELLSEIRALDPSSTFPSKARLKCLLQRAEARLAANDPAEAVVLMRAARETSPGDASVLHNLAVALFRWMKLFVDEQRCPQALGVAEELRVLGAPRIPPAEVDRALGRCKR